MTEENYCFDIGEEGQQGLHILDELFNPSTQTFLTQSGLKPGMHVLDIGCGLGTMTIWLAQQVGPKGTVTAIDNNHYQIKATLKQAEHHALKNVNALCLSAYDITSLNQTFDLIYCRFILHHIHKPSDVIQSVYQVLNKHGIFAAEEGLVSQAFSYPLSTAWGNERWHNDPKDHDTEGKSRDGNFGMKIYHVMHHTGFQDLTAHLVQPIVRTPHHRKLFANNRIESKRSFLEQGHSEEQWLAYCTQIQDLAKDHSAMIAFYQSCQVKGVKRE